MSYLKKVGKSLLYIIIPSIIFMFILTILNYFDIISYNSLNIIKYILFFISIFISSFILGKNSNALGWLEGFKYGLIIIVILLLFNYLIFMTPFNMKVIIYYLVILATSTIASMLGINLKKK